MDSAGIVRFGPFFASRCLKAAADGFRPHGLGREITDAEILYRGGHGGLIDGLRLCFRL